MKSFFLAILTFLTFIPCLKAQNQLSPDELFKEARTAAFDQKDYGRAKALAYHALAQSPGYSDIDIFIGRLFMWDHRYDSARFHFTKVLKQEPSNQDASVAYSNVEYLDGNYESSIEICDKALNYCPDSQDLLLQKAKSLMALKEYKQAILVTDQILKFNQQNRLAYALATALKDSICSNKITLNYENSSFDKQYDKAWNQASLSYGRSTKFGTLIGRLNYASRFGGKGFQGEVDAYPRISKTFYAYINAGYSGESSIFPRYRAGFSLYTNLPNSFEGEIGYRYLYFNSPVNIYTAALGKYWKNFLFSARTYVTPSTAAISQSYTFSSRYYFKGANDYLGLMLGTGFSPDDNNQNIQYSNKQNKFSSKKISLDFSHTFLKWNIVSLNLGMINQEYLPSMRGNQYDLSLTLSHRF